MSLVTALADQCYTIRAARRWTNYGLDRIRFTAPIFPGDRLRLRVTLDALATGPGASTRLDLGLRLDSEGNDRTALVATWIVLGEER